MMLVLSRKKGEAIQIGENIVVTIAEVRGGRVRLSIEAPRSIPIVRQEVVQRQEHCEAASLLLSGSDDCRI